MNSQAKGFTLIELLLVVTILALLIAIIVVAATEIHRDSKKKAMYASLKNLQVAIESYYLHQDAFPPEATWNQTNPPPPLLVWVKDKPRAVNSIPKDIFRNTRPRVSYYLYEAAGEKTTYVAFSYGPNKNPEITGVGNDVLVPDAEPADDIYTTNAHDRTYEE